MDRFTLSFNIIQSNPMIQMLVHPTTGRRMGYVAGGINILIGQPLAVVLNQWRSLQGPAPISNTTTLTRGGPEIVKCGEIPIFNGSCYACRSFVSRVNDKRNMMTDQGQKWILVCPDCQQRHLP